MTDKSNMKLNLLKSIFSALFLCAYVVLITLSGGNPLGLLGFIFSTITSIILPGFFLFRAFGLNKHLKNFTYPLIFLLGCSAFTLYYLLCIALTIEFATIMLPLCSTAIFLFMMRTRPLNCSFTTVKKILFDNNSFSTLLLLVSFLLCIYGFISTGYAHPSLVGDIRLSQDFLWNIGNAQSFSLGLPPSDIRFLGVELRYHFFGELLVAALACVNGVSEYNIIAFYMQTLYLPTLVATLYLLGYHFYNNRFKATIFTIFIFSLSCLSLHKILPEGSSRFSNSFITSIVTNINSMAPALIFLSIFAVLLSALQKNNFKPSWGLYLACILSFTLLTFSKSPIAAILAIALFCTLIAKLLIHRRLILGETLLFLLLSVGFLLLYQGYLSAGANVSTGFDITYSLKQGYFVNILHRISIELPTYYTAAAILFIIAQSFLMAPFTLPLFVIGGFKSLKKLKTVSSWHLACFACGLGGFVAFFTTFHTSSSHVYFFYIAIFCVTFIAVEQFNFDRLSIKTIIPYGLLTLSIITTIFLYSHFLLDGTQQLLSNYDILPKQSYRYVVKSDDEAAGIYLNSIMRQGDVFITNRVHSHTGEGLSNVYTAFSGMQSYMEGFKYTISNMGISTDVVAERYNFIVHLFDGSMTHEEIVSACSQRDIDYIVYSKQEVGETTQFSEFQTVFSSDWVTIFKV